MAIQGPIPVDFGIAFPARGVRGRGVRAGAGLRPVAGGPVRAAERQGNGAPLWAVEVIDADPQARARTVKIKVISARSSRYFRPPPAGRRSCRWSSPA